MTEHKDNPLASELGGALDEYTSARRSWGEAYAAIAKALGQDDDIGEQGPSERQLYTLALTMLEADERGQLPEDASETRDEVVQRARLYLDSVDRLSMLTATLNRSLEELFKEDEPEEQQER